MPADKKTLNEIVTDLQTGWADLNVDCVDTAIADLRNLRNLQQNEGEDNPGYKYDDTKFPPLGQDQYGKYKDENQSDRWKDPEKDEYPINLAEALLWKLGKWRSYEVFVQDYESEAERDHDEEKALVFYAFARHLRDDTNPIFDQHAARALWAISPNFWGSSDESITGSVLSHYKGHRGDLVFHYLMKQNGEWKSTGGGDTSMGCLRYCLKEIEDTCSRTGLHSSHLDKLLMPLGQALKDYSDRDNESGIKTGINPKHRTSAEKEQVFLSFLRLVGREGLLLEEFTKRRTAAKRSIRNTAN